MAKVANAYTTYQAGGNREDLADRIYNIDPFDTPGRLDDRSAQRQEPDVRLADREHAGGRCQQCAGGRLRACALAGSAVVRQTNLTQISKRDATVSASQEASDAAGKNSEMAHQMAIKSKALKCDVEVIAFSRQAKSSDDSDDRHPQDGEHSAPDRAGG